MNYCIKSVTLILLYVTVMISNYIRLAIQPIMSDNIELVKILRIQYKHQKARKQKNINLSYPVHDLYITGFMFF